MDTPFLQHQTAESGAVTKAASDPTPSKRKYARAKLQTSSQIGNELASIYRSMKAGTLDPNLGTKLTYVLSTLVRIRVDESIETRLEALENRGY